MCISLKFFQSVRVNMQTDESEVVTNGFTKIHDEHSDHGGQRSDHHDEVSTYLNVRCILPSLVIRGYHGTPSNPHD